jgi:hypothetical protein
MIQIDGSGILKRPEELDLAALFHSPDGNTRAHYELEAEVCCETKLGMAARYFTYSNSSQLSDASRINVPNSELSRGDVSTNSLVPRVILTGL